MTSNISIQATLNNSANFFVVAWYTSGSSPVFINKIVPTKPYGNPFQVPITGLTAGTTYVIKLWESADSSPAGVVRNSMSHTPQQTNTTVRFPEYLTADITPGLVNNTSVYVNLTYAGWGYDVERLPNGTMFPVGAPDAIDPDYDQDSAGGFHLVRTGDVWAINEKLVVRFTPQVAPAVASVIGELTSSVTIVAATTMDNTYLNQAVFVQGSGSTVPIVLPSLGTVMDFQFIKLYSAGGNHVSAPITTSGSDKIQRKTQITRIVLNQNEGLKIFKANGIWNVDYVSPTVDMVGEIIYKSVNTDFNYLFLDGSLVSRTVYARLYDKFSAMGGSVSEATWGAAANVDGRIYHLNKGFWTQGTDGTNFRLPLLTGQFIRAVDGSTRTAMSGELDAQIQHSHNLLTGLFPGAPNGKGPVFINAARYNGQATGATDLTSGMFNTPGANVQGTALQRQDVEVRPANTGEYAIIRL